ncbi:MAG TPA: hypothetical protein VFM77_05040 [Terriglobales bacterium]|nr:hypothetical protein [Terriglobales bacterium]
MTLSRFVLLLFVLASISAYAADPKQQPTTPDAPWSTTLESLHLVPWFTGMEHVNQDLRRAPQPVTRANHVLSTPAALKGVSCLKLRTYKVRGRETLPDNESAFVSYSTCQWTTNYQVRSAVQTVPEPH